MNIVWLSESPIQTSGYGTQTLEFGKQFQQMGHTMTVMALNSPINTPYTHEGIKVYPLPINASASQFRAVWKSIIEPVDIFVAFVDIHFIQSVFHENEKDIKEKCPFVLYHLWDNAPTPIFNMPIYSTLDNLICASEFTYHLLQPMVSASNIPINYAPLGFNPSIFHPLSIVDKQYFMNNTLSKLKNKVNFIICSTNANIHRKRLGDVLAVYAEFSKGKDDVAIIMHCNFEDYRGVDLHAMQNILIGKTPNRYVIISPPRGQKPEYLNMLYNISDVSLNMAHSEGFGLQTIESMAAGTPPIVGNFGNHPYMLNEQAGYLINPSISHLTGGIGADFIYEHYVSNKDVVNALNMCYNNRDELKQKSLNSIEQAKKFSIQDSSKKLISILQETINNKQANKSYNVGVR